MNHWNNGEENNEAYDEAIIQALGLEAQRIGALMNQDWTLLQLIDEGIEKLLGREVAK